MKSRVSCIQPMFHFIEKPRPPRVVARVTPGHEVDSSAMVIAPGTRLPLRPLLERSIGQRRLAGTHWVGAWTDVGTPARLASLQHA